MRCAIPIALAFIPGQQDGAVLGVLGILVSRTQERTTRFGPLLPLNGSVSVLNHPMGTLSVEMEPMPVGCCVSHLSIHVAGLVLHKGEVKHP